MRLHRRALIGLLLSLSVLGGCYSFSTLQEPRTLNAGGVRVAPKVRITPQDRTLDSPYVGASAEVDLRVGLAQRFELQVGVGLPGIARAAVKALVLDWDKLTLAVVPTYQIQITQEDSDRIPDDERLPKYRTQAFILPLIAAIPIERTVGFLVGADVHAGRQHALASNNQSGGFLSLGVHLGFAANAGRHVTFVPQCGVLVTVASTPTRPSTSEGYDIDDLQRGNVTWECAFGTSFGGAFARRDTQ